MIIQMRGLLEVSWKRVLCMRMTEPSVCVECQLCFTEFTISIDQLLAENNDINRL